MDTNEKQILQLEQIKNNTSSIKDSIIENKDKLENLIDTVLFDNSTIELMYTSLVKLIRYKSKLALSGTSLKIIYENLYEQLVKLNQYHSKNADKYKSGVLLINSNSNNNELGIAGIPDELVDTGIVFMDVHQFLKLDNPSINRFNEDNLKLTEGTISLGNIPANYYMDSQTIKNYYLKSEYNYDTSGQYYIVVMISIEYLVKAICQGKIIGVRKIGLADTLHVYYDSVEKWTHFTTDNMTSDDTKTKEEINDTELELLKKSASIKITHNILKDKIRYIDTLMNILIYMAIFNNIKNIGSNVFDREVRARISKAVNWFDVNEYMLKLRYVLKEISNSSVCVTIGSKCDSIETEYEHHDEKSTDFINQNLVMSRQRELDSMFNELVSTTYSPDTLEFLEFKNAENKGSTYKIKFSEKQYEKITNLLDKIKEFLKEDMHDGTELHRN